MIFATDTVSLADVRVSDSGYLEAFARTARTGVQQYLGKELDRPDLSVVNVYRDEADVFAHPALNSFAQIPVTVDHPPKGVNARNWRQVARGTTGTEVLRDGEFLKIGLKIGDAAAITDIQNGKRELSAGYRCELVWGDGTAPDGTKYQAKQTNIVADHIAIVAAGRAGAQCRIGDSWAAFTNHDHSNQESPMKTHMIGDNAVEMSDAAIIAVKGLQSQLATLTTDNLQFVKDKAIVAADHQKAIETKDGEILKLQADHKVVVEAKDKEIETLKGQAVTADKLDAAIVERAAVVDAAKPTLGVGFDPKGKSVADIRRLTVAKRLGDKAVEGKTDEHVTIAFDTLTKVVAANDPIRSVMGDASTQYQVTDTTSAYAAMRGDLEKAYLPQKSA